MLQDIHAIQPSVQQAAQATGGRAFPRAGDMVGELNSVVADGNAAYLLSFSPDTLPDGKYHRIKVTVPGRRGIKLRYRAGYLYTKEPTTLKERIRQAVWQPQDETEIGINAHWTHASEGAAISLRIAATDISVKKQQDRWTDKLDIFLVQLDDTGTRAAVKEQTLALNVTPATYQNLLHNGIPFAEYIAAQTGLRHGAGYRGGRKLRPDGIRYAASYVRKRDAIARRGCGRACAESLLGVFEDSQILAELVTRGDVLIVSELQFVVDKPDFAVFDTGNHLVGSGDGEEAIQQCQLLFQVRHFAELLRNEKILCAAEQCCLCFGNLHHEHGLLLRKTAQANYLVLHLPGLGVADVHVGACHPAQNVGKGGNVAGAVGLHIVQLVHDLPHCLSLISTEALGSTLALGLAQLRLQNM